MADTTAIHSLPFPEPTDFVNIGPQDFEDLADAIDPLLTPFDSGTVALRPSSTPGSPGKAGRRYYATDTGQLFEDYGTGWLDVPLRPPLVTALPTTGLYDGKQIRFQSAAMATDGLEWHLVYRAATGWAFLGGGELIAETGPFISHPSTTFTALAGGPTIALPLPGDYLVRTESSMLVYAALAGCMAATSAPAVNEANDAKLAASGVASYTSVSKTNEMLNISGTLSIYARRTDTSGAALFRGNRIVARPLRLNAA